MAGKVYAVMNRKGGVGKTTTAVTLAVGLARRMLGGGNGQVGYALVVDLDPQGNVAASLGVKAKKPNIADLLLGRAKIKECVQGAGEQRPNLFILPSDDSLAKAKMQIAALDAAETLAARYEGGDLPTETRLNSLLEDKLAQARKFDFTIIDCPPSLDILAKAVFRFSDGVIVPVKPDYLGAEGTKQHTKNILEAQSEGIDIYANWLVPTFYRKRELLANQVLDSLRNKYGADRVAPPIPQAVAVEQAPASGGLTVIEYDPSSPASVAYHQLVEMVYATR